MTIINKLKEHYLLMLILILAAVLRFFHADYQSVWLDEIHTLIEADPNISIAELYNYLKVVDPHPPLYFLLVKYAFLLFGHTSMVLRLFSAIIGIISVYILYLLGTEIHSKRAGLFSAALLSANYFHLYYSQDGRPYALFLLSTCLSFLFLIKFIKTPTLKGVFLYAVFTAIMLYSHLFSLFILVSQCFILLFFIYKPFEVSQKKFFLYCLLGGFLIALFYLPVIPIILAASARSSFWIAPLANDVYTVLIAGFFGNSELTIILFVVLAVNYFQLVFSERGNTHQLYKSAKCKEIRKSYNFTFIILFSWIFVTLLLPLIKSYLSVPIIVDRYFICVLPAVILLAAISLSAIRNVVAVRVIFSSIVLFSLLDIVVVKDYYHTEIKSQFRDVSNYIEQQNDQGDVVLSELEWYFNFMLKGSGIKGQHISLEDYVADIKGTGQLKPFWYANAHTRPYQVSEEAHRFLEENFMIDKSIDALDAWARHYIPKKDFRQEIDIFINTLSAKKINFFIDTFSFENNTIELEGWGCFEGEDYQNCVSSVLLYSGSRGYRLQTIDHRREDLTNINNKDLKYSGFVVNTIITNIPAGHYKVALLIVNTKTGERGIAISDKSVTINQ